MEHRTAAVESLLMNVSQDPYSSKAKSYQIEEYKIFEGVLLFNNCGSKSEYVGSSRARCVCASPLLLLPPISCRKQKSAITVIKNSVVEDQSTIHYYYSTCAVAGVYAQSSSVNRPSIDTFIFISI